VTQFLPLRYSTASDKCWGEKAWYEANIAWHTTILIPRLISSQHEQDPGGIQTVDFQHLKSGGSNQIVEQNRMDACSSKGMVK